MWRELWKAGFRDFILDLLRLTQGGESQEDDALILCINLHGLNYERRQGEKKLVASVLTRTSTSAGKKGKRSGGGTGVTPVSEQSSGPPAKKQLMASIAGTTGGDWKARTPRFSKDQMDDALKRVQPTLREAWDKSDLYWKRGLAGHKWIICLKEISLSSTKKSGKKAKKEASEILTVVPTISAAKKMAPVHTKGPDVTSLPMQDHVLAKLRVKAGYTRQPRVSSSTSARRVFKVDFKEEELD